MLSNRKLKIGLNIALCSIDESAIAKTRGFGPILNFFRFMLVIWPLVAVKMIKISYNTIERLSLVADKKLSKNREGT